jgi:hypothetical protein
LCKSASKPVISSFYRPKTPLHLNGRLNAQVESDIVGYTTITMEAGKWYMVATPFAALDDALLEGATLNQLYGNAGFATGDTLYVLINGLFQPRYWIQGTTAETTGWSTRPTRLVEDPALVKPGQSVYISKGSAGDIVLAGAVKALPAEFGLEEGEAWAMVTPIWPADTKLLNDFTWTGVEAGDTLYRVTDAGVFIPLYWIQGATPETSGWSTRPTRLVADTKPLSVGEGVYINKRSKGVATVQAR